MIYCAASITPPIVVPAPTSAGTARPLMRSLAGIAEGSSIGAVSAGASHCTWKSGGFEQPLPSQAEQQGAEVARQSSCSALVACSVPTGTDIEGIPREKTHVNQDSCTQKQRRTDGCVLCSCYRPAELHILHNEALLGGVLRLRWNSNVLASHQISCVYISDSRQAADLVHCILLAARTPLTTHGLRVRHTILQFNENCTGV